MHDLLKQQIAAFMGEHVENKDFSLFIEAVNATYIKNKCDRDSLEQLLEYFSIELNENTKTLAIEKQERIAVESKLHYLENFDRVTGLVNRNLLEDRLHQYTTIAYRYNKKVVFILVGLNNFKWINESLGLSLCDRLLKSVATRLSVCVRECDTVAHFRESEFVLVLSPVEYDGATGLDQPVSFIINALQRILMNLAKPFSVDGNNIQLTCNIGACVYPCDGTKMDELFKHAGVALAHSEQFGPNNYQIYEPDLDGKVTEKFSLYSRLQYAVEHGEFILHFQPQVSLDTGVVSGVEALIRWNHPELGILSPAHFIPLAEETGLIIPIGEWVMKTVCWQIKHWQEAGLGDVRVAINLSARQLAHSDLLHFIMQVLDETTVKPYCLEIELTESQLMKDIDRAIEILTDIKNIGIQLSIDDFGTGYSSLSYLKRLPIHALKIDQSFVQDITIDADGAAISKSIISMAHNLGLRVIAEGVETEAQCKFLSQHQCDDIQGFLYSKGLPAKDLEELLRERRHLPSHLLQSPKHTNTLLLLNENEGNICSIKRLCRYDGYRIFSANTAIEALVILENNRVDVVVSEHAASTRGFLKNTKEKFPEVIQIVFFEETDMQTLDIIAHESDTAQFVANHCSDAYLKWQIEEAFKRKQFFDENQQLALALQVAQRDLAYMNRELKEVLNYKIFRT